MSASVHCQVTGRRALVTIDRPPLNILDLTVLEELDRAIRELAVESELQVLVVRGGGERAFSAGVAVQDHTPEKVERMLTTFHAALGRLREIPALTVAAVRGHCLGGGMELAAACDLVLAEAGSRFGQPEIELGCFPPFAAALYPRLLGEGRTLELLLTGRIVESDEARSIGFVHEVAPAGGLEAAVEALVGRVLDKSAAVGRLLKRAVIAARDRSFVSALDASERIYLQELCASEDMHEGLAAFLEKRRPTWKHR